MPSHNAGRIDVSTRWRKSTAWSSEYSSVESVRMRFLTFNSGLTSADEAQRVDTTVWPRLSSQVLSSLRWVVLPDPSGPSNAISNPRDPSRSAMSRRRFGAGVFRAMLR